MGASEWGGVSRAQPRQNVSRPRACWEKVSGDLRASQKELGWPHPQVGTWPLREVRGSVGRGRWRTHATPFHPKPAL